MHPDLGMEAHVCNRTVKGVGTESPPDFADKPVETFGEFWIQGETLSSVVRWELTEDTQHGSLSSISACTLLHTRVHTHRGLFVK